MRINTLPAEGITQFMFDFPVNDGSMTAVIWALRNVGLDVTIKSYETFAIVSVSSICECKGDIKWLK